MHENYLKMKKTFLLVLFQISLVIVYAQGDRKQLNDDFRKLDWLKGNWVRMNVKPGRTASETWKQISATEWEGLGTTLNGRDTVFIEKLKLLVRDDTIYYVADIAENSEPVYFKLTMLTADSFVCENPQHDFPKKIAYRREGRGMKATVSGNGKSIDYLFERK